MTIALMPARGRAPLRLTLIASTFLWLGCEFQRAVEPAETAVTRVVLTPPTATTTTSGVTQFVAVGLTDVGDTVDMQVTWAASGGVIDQTTNSGGRYFGQFRAGATPGSYAIVVREAGGRADTSAVTVTAVPVAAVIVSPGTASVGVGRTLQLTAVVRDGAGNDLTGRVVTWASGAAGIASVNGSGLVTGVAAGTVTITGTSEGVSGTASVTVTTVPVATVTVSPATANVPSGSTVQLTAVARDAAGNTLTGRSFNWTSDNTNVATVNGSGRVTGVAAGTVTITATSEGVSGTASVTVTTVPVASVVVSPATASVSTGLTVQLTAVARDAVGNTLAGRPFSWASDNTNVATVNGSGLVTGVAAGTVTITATSEGVSGTASVTVTTAVPGTCPQLPTPPPGYCTGRVVTVSPGSATIPTLSPGDVVVFEDGIYTDTDGDGTIVSVQQGGTAAGYVTFVARNRWGAKIDGQNNTARYGFNFGNAVSYVRIHGFDIFGMGSTYDGTVAAPSASGIMIQVGGAFAQIVGNHIHHISNFCNPTIRAQTGIFIQHPSVLVEGNVLNDIGRFDPGENGCTYPAGFTKYRTSNTGVYLQNGPDNITIRNNVFSNHRNGWGVFFYQGTPSNVKILNNTFAFGNPYWSQTHIFSDADLVDVQIRNNVFYDPAGGYLMAWDLEPLVNVVISHNVASGQLLISGADGSPVTTLPPGMTESNNRYATDPMLADPGTFDFHLRAGSPAIDMGMYLAEVTHDFEWRTRPRGAAYDAGAYEF
ncbi:MAG TPA: Ig-like domain-containing protein [Gemmatimonadales bacterium]